MKQKLHGPKKRPDASLRGKSRQEPGNRKQGSSIWHTLEEAKKKQETIRNRVEKASIWAYRAAIEPAWNVKDGETLDDEVALRMQPLVSKFFELCEAHGVTRTAEGDWNRIENQQERLGKIVRLE